MRPQLPFLLIPTTFHLSTLQSAACCWEHPGTYSSWASAQGGSLCLDFPPRRVACWLPSSAAPQRPSPASLSKTHPPLVLLHFSPSPSHHWKPQCNALVAQSCPTLCNPMDYTPPGSSVHGLLQARILECVAIQGILPTQESNLGLLYCRQFLYHLSHQGRTQVRVAL